MGRLTKEQVRAARKTEKVEVPELGSFILRELTIGEVSLLDKDDAAQQLALMIVDESGVPIYNDDEGREILRELSAGITTRLLTEAARLNNVGQAAMDQIIKNLEASPSAAPESA